MLKRSEKLGVNGAPKLPTHASGELGLADATHCSQNNKDSLFQDKSPQTAGPWSAYFRLWAYATYLELFIRLLAAASAAGAGVAYPLMAIIFGNLVDNFNGWALGRLSPADFRHSVSHNALWFVYLFIGKVALKYFACVAFSITASNMTRRIRRRYLELVIRQPISYFDEHTPGSVSSSLSSDPNLVEVGLAEKVGTASQSLSMIVSSFIIALAKNWKLALVSCTVVPYTILVTGVLMSMDAKIEAKVRDLYSKASTLAEEALSSIPTILALDANGKLVAKYKQYVKDATSAGIWRGPLQASTYGNMFFAMHSTYALALYYGAQLVSRGEITSGGKVLTILYCIIMGSSALGLVAPAIPDFIKAAAAAQRILKTLGETPKNHKHNEKKTQITLSDLRGSVEIRDVTFFYPARPKVSVLKSATMSFAPHQVTALVGPSGSGKSTIFALLERWYELSLGNIFVDGTDIAGLSLDWWRSQIALVQQEPMLFNDTIFENVLNGLRPELVDQLRAEERRRLVVDACSQANAHDFIQELPDGYNTRVGERADMLSGGQKQRIAIARAIISNPKILLLDEATSALDAESERAVQAALDKAAKGRTTIIVAHRLSTIEHADKIIVMKDGSTVEEGTHQELLGQQGSYYRLLSAQTAVPDARMYAPTYRAGVEPITQVEEHPLKDVEKMYVGEVTLNSDTINRRISLVGCLWRIITSRPAAVPTCIGGILGSTMASAGFPLQAFLFSKLVTVFQLRGSNLTNQANFWSLMFFVLGLSDILSYFLIFFLLGISNIQISRVLRPNYLYAMLSQDISFFEVEGHSSGSLTALLLSDAEDLELMIAQNIGLVFVFVVDLIACCILALAVYWKLALVAIVGCLPALLLAGFLRLRFERYAQDRCAKFFLESARFSAEAIAAIRTVSSFGLESRIVDRYGKRLEEAIAASAKASFVSMFFFSLFDSLDFLAMGLCFWYGGRLVSFHELSISKFFIIFTAILFGGQAAGFMFGFTTNFSKAQAAANHMLYMIAKKPVINSTKGTDPQKIDVTDTVIEMQDVHFRYPTRPEVEVLRSVSLVVHRGEDIAIVGPSGCGKSTIVALLERFYDATDGHILIRGKDIKSLDIKSYRSMLGLVSQEPTLYQGTIRENLLLGAESEKIRDEQLAEACRTANIYDFIVSLPEGYDTDCGPRGLALSGGQRQRMAIARALLRNPEILLLDEATSALDPENESLMRAAIEKAAEGRTTISVTHSQEVMKNADRIVVLENGRLVEEGAFEELMARQGPVLENDGGG